MVVLSAAITTKSGKALISRQFVEMTRIRIEGLLAAFPKLMGSDSKQHTYVETEAVRYIYQPMESLYLLLITNRASNIVEDLETLRLLSKVVPDIAGQANNLSEEKITDKCFELIFAFDEVITAGGYREPITLQQIRTNLEMESHEEKLHLMIKSSKMESAKDQARDAAKVIRERQREQSRVAPPAVTGFGGGSGSMDDPLTSPSEAMIVDTPVVSRPVANTRAPPVKGMSLMAKGAKNKSLEEALVKEDKLAPIMATSSRTTATEVAAPPVQAAVQHPVMLQIVERVSAKMTRDGMVDSFEIKGSLTLTTTTEEASSCSVQLSVGSLDQFTIVTHPKINKQMYDKSSALQLKDTSKGFPCARPLGVLRWTHSSNSDDLIPLKINCWPEEESRGQMNVSIDYSMDQDSLSLHDVRIHIPLGTSDAPTILSVDGNHKHNSQTGELIWEVDLIDRSNSSGSLEFNIAQRNPDAFFPISVQFSSQQLFASIEVVAVKHVDGGGPIMYGLSKGIVTDEYVIE
eukprot:CAMPEP_0182418304 /NCGR_PEP_ID=MMETSP1167-20130531/2772_1 /TAXON_ID=2988 /ORGANISM="Mallomonas Sp, Strain CCMP3275" /LENGTH=517 /DNA_ID=CAMNT_0024592451 /DNA_START=113 /DNA_END=1666 /DNA_ORIENTATION=+